MVVGQGGYVCTKSKPTFTSYDLPVAPLTTIALCQYYQAHNLLSQTVHGAQTESRGGIYIQIVLAKMGGSPKVEIKLTLLYLSIEMNKGKKVNESIGGYDEY